MFGREGARERCLGLQAQLRRLAQKRVHEPSVVQTTFQGANLVRRRDEELLVEISCHEAIRGESVFMAFTFGTGSATRSKRSVSAGERLKA
ncbi:MAG: hypothetical protein JWO39_2176 [Gemmatimonadetes bacterium]|nr:hypothetical protein [Gemmatimonadota bacterium]